MEGTGPRILQGAIFKIFPVEAAATSNLKNWISQLGGLCLNDSTAVQNPVLATFAIPLVDLAFYGPNEAVEFTKPPEDEFKDFFKSNFIYDTYIAKKRKDLNKYRVGPSLFAKYDANLFIERNLAWDLLAAQAANVTLNSSSNSNVESENRERSGSRSSPNRSRDRNGNGNGTQSVETPPPEETTPDSPPPTRRRSSSSSSSSSSVSSSTPETPRRRESRSRPSARNLELVRNSCPEAFDRWRERQRSGRSLRGIVKRSAYFKDESRCLLGFICYYDLHSGICGRLMWEHMEKLGVWERTWQSLKNHFLKQIYPNLREMACRLGDLEKFKASERERKKNGRKSFFRFPFYDEVHRPE